MVFLLLKGFLWIDVNFPNKGHAILMQFIFIVHFANKWDSLNFKVASFYYYRKKNFVKNCKLLIRFLLENKKKWWLFNPLSRVHSPPPPCGFLPFTQKIFRQPIPEISWLFSLRIPPPHMSYGSPKSPTAERVKE